MSLQFPGTAVSLPRNALLKGITLESLYQISDQSIWFLTWIFKKAGFWPDLTRKALEIPFTAKRQYWPNGQIASLVVKKNNMNHGIVRGWYKNGQLEWEHYRKNVLLHGTFRRWYENGQQYTNEYWMDGNRVF